MSKSKSKSKDYRVHLETPEGKCDVEADNISELKRLLPTAVARMFEGQGECKAVTKTVRRAPGQK